MAARRRLGLIVPSSNTVAEVDFMGGVPADTTVHTARAYLAETTAAAERAMLERHLPQAVQDLATAHPDVIVLSCTSAASLLGAEGEDELVQEMAATTGIAVVSTAAAVGEVLGRLPGARVGVMTAYIDELNRSIAASLRGRGVDVVHIDGLGITDNFAIALVEPADLVAATQARLGRLPLDVLFVSCTNLRALEALPALEQAFGIPVVTSNSAALTVALERLEVVTAAAERAG